MSVHPYFAVIVQTFRFKTRVQRLNSMEASARANINFLEQLYIFHRQQEHGGVRITIPTVNHRPVDLWRLKKEVNQLGGYIQARVLNLLPSPWRPSNICSS
jgi:[histone H3]-trimethyl-L-lysine4 demethylase